MYVDHPLMQKPIRFLLAVAVEIVEPIANVIDMLLGFLFRSLSATRRAVFCYLLTLLLPSLYFVVPTVKVSRRLTQREIRTATSPYQNESHSTRGEQ